MALFDDQRVDCQNVIECPSKPHSLPSMPATWQASRQQLKCAVMMGQSASSNNACNHVQLRSWLGNKWVSRFHKYQYHLPTFLGYNRHDVWNTHERNMVDHVSRGKKNTMTKRHHLFSAILYQSTRTKIGKNGIIMDSPPILLDAWETLDSSKQLRENREYQHP